MIRPPAMQALALVMTSVLALNVPSAQASVEMIPKGSTLTGVRTETAVRETDQIDWFPLTKQLIKTVPFTEETITGPTTKVIKEWEARTYTTEKRLHLLNQEMQREVTSYRKDYIRRTTSQVVDRTWNVWMVGGTLNTGYVFGADLVNKPIPSNGDYRNATKPYVPPGRKERSQAEFDRANTLAVKIAPHGEYTDYLYTNLYFDKRTLAFLGGTIICHNHKNAKVPTARVIRHATYDEIEYRLNCELNEDPWGWSWCETDRSTWTLKLNGKLLASETRTAYRTQTTDTPHVAYTESYGPWTPTGPATKGGDLGRRPKYETSTENVLISQRTAVNSAHAVKAIATASNLDHRRVFTSDASSAQSRASLSGTQVRRTLGADQAKASRLAASSHGAGAPDLPASLPGLRRGNGGSHGVTPSPAPEAAANATPSAPVATHPTPVPPKTVKATPAPDPWWFPKNPRTPPARIRLGNYRKRG